MRRRKWLLDRSLPKLVMQSENLSHLLYLVISHLTARSYLALFLSLKLPNFNCVKRRSRALWRVVRMHVVLRSVAWWWFELRVELPSRSTRFETELCKAIGEFETECANKRFW